MNHLRRFLLVAPLLAGFGLSACGTPPSGNDGGTDGGGSGDCFDEFDCPDPQLFFCNTTTSKCEPACRTKTDCTAAVRGQYELAFCNGTLGCQCDEGACVGSLCSADSDCGTMVCRSGQCVTAPTAADVAKCSIQPDYQVMPTGGKAKFYVSAWDAQNKPVVVKDGATWTSEDGAVTMTTASKNSAEYTAANMSITTPVDAVKAAFGGISCTAKVLVLPSTATAGHVVAVVSDELSGRPISGATVLVSDTTSGAGIGTATSGTNGFYDVNVTGNPTMVTVSVFHADYNYLTIGNYPMSGTRVLSAVLRRNQVDKFGGYKGGFTNVPASSNIHSGIAGMSLAGSITDLSFAQLLGPSTPTDIKIGSAIDQKAVPVPAGVYLGFTDSVIKGTVSGQGLAGTCVTPQDATAVDEGRCGTRSAWALAGDVPLGDLPIDAFAGGTSNIDYGKVLSRIIPIFKKFNSSVARDVQFSLKATPRTGGEYDFSDTSAFTAKDHAFAPAVAPATNSAVPLAFNFAVNVPDLPKFKGAFSDGAVLLGGANVTGRGVVPLGMGVAVNTATPLDAKTDVQAELPAAGLVSMRMAPTHNGIEGSEYGLIALALSLKSISDASAGIATSALYSRVSGNALKFDPKGATPVAMGGAFLAFPEGSRYNFTNAAQAALAARTFKLTPPSGVTLSEVSVVRVSFSDDLDHRWVVYASVAEAANGIRLPTPPGAFTDRTYAGGVTGSGVRSTLLAQLVRLNDNPTGSGSLISYGGLVEFNNTNYDRLIDFTTAFSFIDYARPEVAWQTPSAAGAAVQKSSSVTVKVTGFKVGTAAGDDGLVRVTFTPSAGTCTQVADGTTDASQGKGEISIALSSLTGAGCTGAGSLKATLFDNQGTPVMIAPEVSDSIAVTLQ